MYIYYINIWLSAVWVGPCDYLVTLPIGGHKVPGHKVPGHKVTVTRSWVRASPRMSKSVGKVCSTHEKKQCIMHLTAVSEEASEVKKY